MSRLPTQLYTREAVAEFDRLAIACGIPGYTLMRRAGAAVFAELQRRFDTPQKLLVLCGAGNNAGDGYVIARLAKQAGWPVSVISLSDAGKLRGDAATACAHWRELGDISGFNGTLPDDADVLVDALLGTGLTRDVEGQWRQLIEQVNASGRFTLAVDIPSGLDANSGVIRGAAIEADVTVSFIGLKQGLFTASGKQCCGEIVFDDLAVPAAVLQQQMPSARLLDKSILHSMPRRRQDSHKGDYGHLLIIGGNHGMAGAVALCARAALKTGAGRVTVVSRAQHVAIVTGLCPEAMVYASDNGEIDDALLAAASHVVIGPGLGQDAWARRLLYVVRLLDKPLLYDADALNLLAQSCAAGQPFPSNAAVITPHPGEAARLLQISTNTVQQQRFDAVRRCTQLSGAVTVLKGSGSLIDDGSEPAVCTYGTAAMASAGMGDVLAGIVGGWLAQGCDASLAARLGVCIHALAAQTAAAGADRGIVAGDVIDCLPAVFSQSCED